MKEITIEPPHDGRRAFNASICEFAGKLWMAYRVSYSDKPDRLRIAELDPVTFAVRFDRPLVVPLAEGWGAEDPRLFVHGNALHVAWTAADYQRTPWKATMFYGAIGHTLDRHDTVMVARAYQPRFGFNLIDQREKNWQFWSAGGFLFAQYGPSPQNVIQLEGEKVVGEWKSPGFEWGHGRPSGGTPPIRTGDGTMLTFFHSFVPHVSRDRLYSFAAMEFRRDAPFDVIRVSPAPIVSASDQWPKAWDRWAPLCVFPAGVVRRGDSYLVSAGINDAGIMLFELGPEDMPMVAPKSLPIPDTGYFRTLKPFLLGGRVRTLGEIVEVEVATAKNLLTRNWLEPYENQIA